jgi:hypothetical protein
MDSVRYIGLDVHRDTVSAAVLDKEGKLVMQSVLATRAPAILDFLGGIQGTLQVTFEEGTHSAWLYDLLVRRVARLVVCDPRKNALLKSGNKGDLIDARKLAELLRNHSLSPVYHGENSALEMQHRTRSYTTLTEDTTRVMSRLKALFRSQAIHCPGKKLFRPDYRESYLTQLGSDVCGNEPSAFTWSWTPCTQCGCEQSARWLPNAANTRPLSGCNRSHSWGKSGPRC